ncbi:MAG: lipoprotein [Spiroplasma sp. hy2]|uniref:lipoprotein n=1 Tax=Spiroplasma sp. hy2 TaxID=2490850 RepID=UPI003841D975
MKRLLSILCIVSLTASEANSVIACDGGNIKQKINLNTINKLTVNIIHEKNKKLSDLNTKIINAQEFINKPLNEGYTINYYSDEDLSNKNDISDFPQFKNIAIYVVIIASKNNKNWEGQTSRLKVVMK